VWNGCAASYFTNKSSSGAIAAFTKAADQDPNDRESIEMRGVSLLSPGRAPEALPFLEKATPPWNGPTSTRSMYLASAMKTWALRRRAPRLCRAIRLRPRLC